ncbi:TPA: hypothetical protein ACSP7Y_005077 [Serratia fonticola]
MNSIERICRDLGLPCGDEFTQDWAYELPEEFRTKECLNKYILTYLNDNYSESERDLLMQLILDVTNDCLSMGMDTNNEIIVKALDLLSNNHQKHFQLIEDWALDGEPLEDCFALTYKAREIKNNIR